MPVLTKIEQEFINSSKSEFQIKKEEIIVLKNYINLLSEYAGKYGTPKKLMHSIVDKGERYILTSKILKIFIKLDAHLIYLLNEDFELAKNAINKLMENRYLEKNSEIYKKRKRLNELKKEIKISINNKKETGKLAKELKDLVKFWENLNSEKRNIFGKLISKKSKFFNKSIIWPLEHMEQKDLKLLNEIETILLNEKDFVNRRFEKGFTFKKTA